MEKGYLLGNKSSIVHSPGNVLTDNLARSPPVPAVQSGCLYGKNKGQFSFCRFKWAQSPRPIDPISQIEGLEGTLRASKVAGGGLGPPRLLLSTSCPTLSGPLQSGTCTFFLISIVLKYT